MTDLIFHIGLSKCASSTLQQEVFRHESGYLGTASDMNPQQDLAKQLQQFTPFAGRQTTDRNGLAGWVSRVRCVQEELWRDAQRLIVSNEMLSGANRISDRPILGVLSLLKNQFWTEGQVRVVIVLRNQAARLASGYAQRSNCRWNAGQQDFERTVRRTLTSRRRLRLFNYLQWLESLESVVGQENVCVLLLEDSRTAGFWEALRDFCSLEYLEPDAMLSSNNSKNVRSRGADSWAIRPLDTEFQARLFVDKWMNLSWPKSFSRDLRNQVRRQSIDRMKNQFERIAARKAAVNREKEICLSPQVMRTIRERCGSYNQLLAAKLHRDLTPLGY